MKSIDQVKPVLLVLLSPSDAFDIVDHEVIFPCLKIMFGPSGKVFE
jgi:hypothetical protein